MQGEERRSLLMTGMSLGELLLVCLLLALMLTEALRGMQVALRRISQVEAFSLLVSDKVHWVETWANDGYQAPEANPPFQSSSEGTYVVPVPARTGDGAANFVLTSRVGPEGEMLTFRPAFPAGSQHVVLWVCGFAPVPKGFVAQGENRTSLAPGQLLSTCRAPIT